MYVPQCLNLPGGGGAFKRTSVHWSHLPYAMKWLESLCCRVKGFGEGGGRGVGTYTAQAGYHVQACFLQEWAHFWSEFLSDVNSSSGRGETWRGGDKAVAGGLARMIKKPEQYQRA